MSTPRLSLCFATMNRPDAVEVALTAVREQLTPECEEQVEVVIIDGSADAATRSAVEAWGRRFARFTYQTQDPRGIDRAYHAAVRAATGDYCWLCSDDDRLRPGALRTMLAALADEPACVVANMELRDENMAEIVMPAVLPPAAQRDFAADEFDAFARAAMNHLNYLGALCLRRSIWMERDIEPYLDCWFAHVGVVFQAPLPAHARIITAPLISQRLAQPSWVRHGLRIWLINWPGLVWGFTHLPEEVRAEICSPEPWRSRAKMIKDRVLGALTWQSYREVLQPLPLGLAQRVWVLGLCLIPRRWLRAAVLAWDERRPVRDRLFITMARCDWH